MKWKKLLLVATLLLVYLADTGYGAPPVKITQQAPVPLIKIDFQAPSTSCRCDGPDNCVCPPGACACANCGGYASAYTTSLSTGQPLVVYVGCRIPNQPAVPGYLICRVNQLNGRRGPCILVTCNGYVCQELSSYATPQDIQQAIQGCRGTQAATTSVLPTYAPYPAVFQPMPMMGGFGGFGGFGGGGCSS